jgi:hypothetical protein
MTKILLTVLMCLLLSSCEPVPDCTTGTKDKPISGCEVPTPIPDDPDTGTSIPNEAFNFGANISYTNFEKADEQKVEKAIELIKKIVASQEFKDKVLNFTYSGKHTFVDNSGFTNAQIYQKLIDGKEDLKAVVDNEMDLDLELYYSSRSTVGYTYETGLRIWMNTKFFDSYTPAEVAGNIFHEWTHKLGFDHASSYSVARDSSVPYAIGYMIEELGKQYE